MPIDRTLQYEYHIAALGLLLDTLFVLASLVPPMVSDSASPPPRGRKPLPVAAFHTPSPPIQARIKRVHRSPAPDQLALPLPKPSFRSLQLQADEDSEGRSSNPDSNSTDDADASNLSCVSSGSSHSNAAPHVYAAGASSQGGFPTPLHMRRGAERGIFTLAGDFHPVLTYHVECCTCVYLTHLHRNY